ncbi:MAG: head maturation protease, ClpP-related [Nitrospinaceae bacterium]
MPKKINLRGMIGFDDQATPEYLESELASANGQDVILEINSPGGFVFDGLEMANMIRNYSGHVTAKVVGIAASMASYIPMMADHIEVEDNTVFMIHNPAGFAMGDHREMEFMAKLLESLRDLLSKAYAKQTGKSHAEITSLMDDTTFLFGDEIADEGFADEVVGGTGEGDKEKESAVMAAQDEIQACKDLIDEAQKGKSVDVEKIAALMGAAKPKRSKTGSIKPATETAKSDEQEQKTMTWQEFLESNPEAKAQYEADLKTAREEGEKAGREAINATMDTALPILSSANYPDTVKEKVGEKMKAGDVEGISEIVSTLDMLTEAQKAEDVKTEQSGETLADGPKADNGLITDAAGLAEAVALHKSTYGMGA